MKGPDGILSEGRTRVQKVQQWILWWKHHITYFLREEQGCSKFSSGFVVKTPHTFWWWKQATTGSAGGFTVHGPDHILPDGGTRPEEISSRFCGEGVRSHTPWVWNKGMRGSAGSFSGKRPDHIQTEGRTRPQEVQQWVFGQREQSTYSLRAEQGCKRSSTGFAVNGTDWDS